MRNFGWLMAGVVVVAAAAGVGVAMRSENAVQQEQGPVYSHGWQPGSIFDDAYAQAKDEPVEGAVAGLVAHHLLVDDKIAEVFNGLASDDVRTVVLVGPNHFSVGISAMQTTKGTWTTPYGDLTVDTVAVERLTNDVDGLRQEELAFRDEHSIAALTPFIKRSFPNAKLVPIMLDESLAPEEAWALGETIASSLPHALLLSSIDMTHNQTAEYTAQNDAAVMTLLADSADCARIHCDVRFDIDSNASLRVLLAFAASRSGSQWRMTHHGSSLAMGATADWRENTSHILGYFLRAN